MRGPHKGSHRYALGSDRPACVWQQMDMAIPHHTKQSWPPLVQEDWPLVHQQVWLGLISWPQEQALALCLLQDLLGC